MALGAHNEELARLLFPLLITRELREAAVPVKATAVLILGHFGSSCARKGNRCTVALCTRTIGRMILAANFVIIFYLNNQKDDLADALQVGL